MPQYEVGNGVSYPSFFRLHTTGAGILYQNLLDQMKEMFKINSTEKLNTEDKEKVILEMFKLLKCNSACANFKFLNESIAFGKKNGRIINDGIIINQSATGLWENYYEF